MGHVEEIGDGIEVPEAGAGGDEGRGADGIADHHSVAFRRTDHDGLHGRPRGLQEGHRGPGGQLRLWGFAGRWLPDGRCQCRENCECLRRGGLYRRRECHGGQYNKQGFLGEGPEWWLQYR